MKLKTLLELSHWQLFVKIMPFVILFCLAKYLFHHYHWEIGEFDSQISSLLGAITFILAFMLSGTLNDYRASSDMPNQIANAIETIEDTNLLISYRYPEYDHTPLSQGLANILKTVIITLKENKSFEEVETKISNLNQLLVPLSKFSEPPLIGRIQAEQAKIRLLISHIQTIRDTHFLAPAYTLLHILFIATTIAMLATYTQDFINNFIISSFLFTAFIYLLFLIYDLDNPFEYDGKASADIDLSYLEHSYQKLIS